MTNPSHGQSFLEKLIVSISAPHFIGMSLLLSLCHPVVVAQRLVINEIMPANETTLVDEDGEFSDWIELYNGTATTIELGGFAITDEEEELDKWVFPNLSIEPGQFLILFASGKDRR